MKLAEGDGCGFWAIGRLEGEREKAGLAAKPSDLAFGVLAGGLLDLGDGLGKGKLALQVGLNFADADGLGAGGGEGRAGGDFLDGSGGNHLVDALLDALMEQGSIPHDHAAFDDRCGALGGGAEGGLGLASEQADLQGALDVAGILQRNVFDCGRVEREQAGDFFFEAQSGELGAQSWVARRKGIEAVGEGF